MKQLELEEMEKASGEYIRKPIFSPNETPKENTEKQQDEKKKESIK